MAAKVGDWQLLQAGSICTRRGICILQIRSDGTRRPAVKQWIERGESGVRVEVELLARLTVHFAMQRAKLLPNNNKNNDDDDDDDLFKPAARSFYQRLANLQRAPPPPPHPTRAALATAALCILPLHLPLQINFRATAAALEQWGKQRRQRLQLVDKPNFTSPLPLPLPLSLAHLASGSPRAKQCIVFGAYTHTRTHSHSSQ